MNAMDDQVGAQIADALGTLLKRSTRASLYRDLTEGLGEAVNEVTYPVLSGLARTGPCSSADLAAEVGLDRSRVSRHASRLEEAGLLRRAPDPADRRSVLLTLTSRGTDTVAVMRQRLAARLTAYLSTWAPQDAHSFADGLRRFTEEGPFAESPGSMD